MRLNDELAEEQRKAASGVVAVRVKDAEPVIKSLRAAGAAESDKEKLCRDYREAGEMAFAAPNSR